MIETFAKRDDQPSIALVTAVPSFIKSLTGKDASQFNRRGIQRLSLTKKTARRPLDILSAAYIDLYFLPAITGDFALRSASNIDELAQRLAPYDLVVDLCEFSALYRRGQTTDAAWAKFLADNGDGTHRGLLEYQNFLNVIEALDTTFGGILGRVIRPFEVTDQFYEWGLSRAGHLAIKAMSLGETTVLHEAQDGNMILDAIPVGPTHDAVAEALGMLDSNGMHTLSSKVMFSGYLSDMAGIQEAVLSSKEPQYTFSLDDIFAHRREKYGCNRPNAGLSEAERALMAHIKASESRLRAKPMRFSLVDYYRISGGPAEMRGRDGSGVDEATKQRYRAFRSKFEAAMAFARHWDALEDTHDTATMNAIVNGWYMSNSCFGILREAAAAGLSVPRTTWGVPTLMTNSIGFIPSAELHDKSTQDAIFGALSEIIPQPVVA